MNNTISLSDLDAEVNSAREGFDGWAAARQNALTAVQEQHGDLIREVNGKCQHAWIRGRRVFGG